MGDRSNLGAWAYVGCSGFISIGSDVLMGPRVSLLAEDHNADSTDEPIKTQGVTRLPITIEDDVWLGAGAPWSAASPSAAGASSRPAPW